MRLLLPDLLIAALAAVLTASTCAAAGGVDHNRYKWRDAAGTLHYGDTLPAEAARLGYEVLNPQGMVVKRIEREKIASELAAAKAELARTQAERAQSDARSQADAQLLAGYPEEADLARAQRQKLELLDQQVIAAQISLRSQEQTLADVLGRAAETERAEKALPAAQAKQLTDLRKQVDNQRLTVVRRENERADAQAVFERETARYRALKLRLAESRQAQ